MLPESDLDNVTVDVGKPLLGILFGILLIAGTIGSFFLWDNHQSGADAISRVRSMDSQMNRPSVGGV